MKSDPETRTLPHRGRCRLGWRALAWVSLWSLALPAFVRAAAHPIEVENLRIGFGSSNSFKVGTWTPVWVQLRGGAERFSGFMDLVVADDDGTPSSFRMAVDVGPKQSQSFTGYIRPGSRDPELTIRLLDRDGRWVASASQDTVMPHPPEVIMPDEVLILTMGRPQGVEMISELPGFLKGGQPVTSPRRAGDEIVTARIDAQTGRLPGRWYGFDAARAIVMETGDREAIASLDGLRGQALVEWVKRGGHLVVAVGANWQAVRDSVLAPILPGLPSGLERVASLEALDTFAGSTKPITPPGAPAVMVTKLEGIDERGGTVLSSVMSSLPLVVRGSYGFGRVTLIALDADQKVFAEWPDRGLFWVRAIDLRRQRADQAVAGPMLGGGTRFYQSGVSDLAGQLRIALEQFPGVKLIPFGWVAFFIVLYILLIGPGDYFFLKKVLKRMELTWITFPTIVVTVSLVAYYAAYLLKGNDLLVNKVDVIDVDQPDGLVRGSTWVSLFSPQNRDYTLGTVPLPLDRDSSQAPSGRAGESSSSRPPPGTEVVMSWFSSPEDRFGAMGSSSRRFSFAGSGYAYQPTGGVEMLENVRIPIWSTKGVTARWFGPAAPLVDSDLQPMGTDRLAGTVANRLDIPLEDAILAFGKQVYLLGTVAPGATLRVELSNDRNLSGYLKSKQGRYLDDPGGNREARIDRADLMLAVMFHDSETTLASERVLSSDPLHDVDLTGQLALQRPMLVARIARPGSRLVLDGAPSPPKIDQTTLVRVILPLKKTKPAG
jgi:hypothetical protein